MSSANPMYVNKYVWYPKNDTLSLDYEQKAVRNVGYIYVVLVVRVTAVTKYASVIILPSAGLRSGYIYIG